MRELLPFVVAYSLSMVIVVLFVFVVGRRLYVRIPPSRVAVRTGYGGARVVRGNGVFVLPCLHRVDFVYTDVEPLDFGDKHFEVRLGDQPEDAIRAFRAFGQKPLDEIRRLLSTLISSAKGDEPIVEAKLAQVGYRII